MNALPLSLVAEIDAAKSAAHIGDRLQDFLQREIGATAISSVRIVSSKLPSFSTHFNTVPKAWAQRYLQANYMSADPFARQIFLTRKPYCWRDVMQRGSLSRKARALIGEASAFDLKDGYFIPVHQTDGSYGLFGLFGPAIEVPPRLRAVIDFLGVYAHLKSELVQNPVRPRRAQLSSREIECLKWVSIGKSDTDIGDILGIADGTVNMHIENAKRKYRATTRLQAVIEAIRDGYLWL